MAEQPELRVEPRTVLGKQVKRLRREGLLPGNIYGHNVASTPVQLSSHEFVRLVKQVGRSTLINLHVAGERRPRPVIIKDIAKRPATSEPLHVDFFQVSLKERMHVDVPVHLTGTSRAISDFNGVLEHFLTTLTVECLPTEIPSHIEGDLSRLENLGDALHVRDLAVPENVSVLMDGDVVVARVSAPKVAEEIAAEEAAAEAEEEAAEAGVPPEEAPTAEAAEEEPEGGE
ncbi:MAG TPA: 50S ribosomal protein L25 [Dehalococcoidia bacterium]